MKAELLKIKHNKKFIDFFVITRGLTTKKSDIEKRMVKGIIAKIENVKSAELICTTFLVYPSDDFKKLSHVKGCGGADIKYTFALTYNDKSEEELDLYWFSLDVF